MDPKERLVAIDSLLQKGWQSFYDFAKAIYCKPGQTYLYDKDFKATRPSIVQDFRLIQDIWHCAHHGELIPTGNSTSDKNPLRAGLIAEIASSPKQFVGHEKKILQAAAIASKKTGFAVSTHTGRINAIETIETLLNEGCDADKIIVGHQDLIDDHEYHVSLLKYGVNIAFDTCGKVAYMPDETRALNAKKLVEEGYEDHLVLSNDISRHTYFTSFGGTGYLAVMGSVVPLMKEYGIEENVINKFLVDNPSRIVNNDNI